MAASALSQPVVELVGSAEDGTIIVEGRLDQVDSPEPLFRAIWRGVAGGGAVFQLQRTAAPDDEVRLMLDRLIEAGIGAYLDAERLAA